MADSGLYTVFAFINLFRKVTLMNLDQLNELINQGGAALILALIAFVLVIYLFRDEIRGTRKKPR